VRQYSNWQGCCGWQMQCASRQRWLKSMSLSLPPLAATNGHSSPAQQSQGLMLRMMHAAQTPTPPHGSAKQHMPLSTTALSTTTSVPHPCIPATSHQQVVHQHLAVMLPARPAAAGAAVVMRPRRTAASSGAEDTRMHEKHSSMQTWMTFHHLHCHAQHQKHQN
jgi:hypothetical protein